MNTHLTKTHNYLHTTTEINFLPHNDKGNESETLLEGEENAILSFFVDADDDVV